MKALRSRLFTLNLFITYFWVVSLSLRTAFTLLWILRSAPRLKQLALAHPLLKLRESIRDKSILIVLKLAFTFSYDKAVEKAADEAVNKAGEVNC